MSLLFESLTKIHKLQQIHFEFVPKINGEPQIAICKECGQDWPCKTNEILEGQTNDN